MKRTADPLGFDRAETSFVFVTPRAWPGRVEWQNDKRASGTWKDVRVIAADGIEQWLDLTPAIALWLGRKIKGLADSIRDLEGFWEEWSAATDPKMTTEIVIGGRTPDMGRVHQWLRQRPSILEIRGDSPDEPYAFLYSSIMNLPEPERLRALSRSVVVENVQQVRACATTFQNPLVIVAPAECREAAGLAVDKGHHIFLSADSRSIDFRNNLWELSRPRRSVIEQGLHESGLSESEAERIARDFGRSIPVLRRHRFRSSARTPSWSDERGAATLISLLFAGAWNENQEGDRNVIETLSGMTHDAYVKALKPFLSMDDPPVHNVGTVWMLKAPLDAWFLLARHLTDEHLKLLEHAILSVLTKTDPKYELEAEKRWAAAIYGKSNPYSGWLRVGLVESLVLVAVYGNRSTHVASTQRFADRVVKTLFTAADKWEAWASMKDVTALLAEAAPDTFMEAVEEILAKNPDLLREIMSDDGSLFDECRHSGLLWALEGIAWSSEYFARAVNVLFALSGTDKGGKWSNRPINCLRDVFAPGLPQTHASPEQRLAVFDALVERDAVKVWEFAKDYYGSGSMSEAHRFKWRDAGGDRRGLEPESREFQREYLNGFLPRLRDLACRKENVASSVAEFTHLSADVRERLIASLEAVDIGSISGDRRAQIFRSLREALNWINSYGDDDRRREVPALRRAYEKFTPADLLERYGWLLGNSWPRLPEGNPDDEHADRDDLVSTAQDKAAREVLDQVPLGRIIEFGATVEYPSVLGRVLGRIVRNEAEDAKVFDALVDNLSKYSLIERGYAISRVEKVGPTWIDTQIARLKSLGNASPDVFALLYLGRDESADTWASVSSLGKEVEDAYWKRASGHSRSFAADAPIAVEKLLDARRPDTALHIAGDRHVSVPSPVLQRLLHDLLTMDEKKLRGDASDEYHLSHVFKQLHQRDDLSLEDQARVEWPYAALFDNLRRHGASPMALHRLLQKDPSFFAELITYIYKRDDRAPHPERMEIDEKSAERRMHVARDILDSWYLLPGVKEDGSIDEKELTDWITEARKKCAETVHVTGGDIQIGLILAHAPDDQDGTWPHVAVRNLIERLNNQVVEELIQNEVFNSRGVVTKNLGDGGQQERQIAERYRQMSEKVKSKWPRTAAMLRSLYRTYDHQAEGEDLNNELRDLRYD